MNDALVKTLKSFGYREVGSGVFAKPIGYSLFSYCNGKLSQLFKGANGEVVTWTSMEIEDDEESFGSFEIQIAAAENKFKATYGYDGSFMFLTAKEKIEDLL